MNYKKPLSLLKLITPQIEKQCQFLNLLHIIFFLLLSLQQPPHPHHHQSTRSCEQRLPSFSPFPNCCPCSASKLCRPAARAQPPSLSATGAAATNRWPPSDPLLSLPLSPAPAQRPRPPPPARRSLLRARRTSIVAAQPNAVAPPLVRREPPPPLHRRCAGGSATDQEARDVSTIQNYFKRTVSTNL
ncbi:hypothetical protein ACS0TY_027320 [Phlomoides rotata]